jgi:hypothetical protein
VPHGVGVHALSLQLLVGQLAGRDAGSFGHGCSLAGSTASGLVRIVLRAARSVTSETSYTNVTADDMV